MLRCLLLPRMSQRQHRRMQHRTTNGAAGFPIRASEERLPNAHVRLTVEVPPSAVEEMYKKEVDWWRKNGKTDVPGFRKSAKKGKQVSVVLRSQTTICPIAL